MGKKLTMEKAKIFTTMGSSAFSNDDRQKQDFYATPPNATRSLLQLETFQDHILEPMCGQGHISKVLEKKGYKVKSYDCIDRGYGEVKNFLFRKSLKDCYDIISNPPYKNVELYVQKCLHLMKNKRQKTALLLRLLFLEGRTRRSLFRQYPPIRIWVSSSRINCAKNGDFNKYRTSAMAFAWFIWEHGYKGPTTLGWFN